MTQIIIHDIDDITDLLSALAAVSQAFTDPTVFAEDRCVFSKADPDATQQPEFDPAASWPEPDPFLPCPDRGTHERLTDCWMCWCDVHRGAAVETDVLRASWDTGLARLLEGEDDR